MPDSTVVSDISPIAILGAGAVGQLIFHQLKQAGQRPYLIVRKGEECEHPLRFQSLSGQMTQTNASLINLSPPLNASTALHSQSEHSLVKQTQLLVVCVKAYQVTDALTSVLPQLPSSCHVLLLHNGMGPHLDIIPLLNGKGLSLGTTSQGAYRADTWSVKQTGEGITQIGGISGTALSEDLKLILTTAVPNCHWCEPILPFLWQKLTVNAVINPLTAILNSPNGELAANEYRQQICDIIDEIVNVASATGVELNKLALTNRVFDVIELTSANFSSMHQDVANKRQTEIDSINGYVVARAKEYGLSVEANALLLKQVQRLEQTH